MFKIVSYINHAYVYDISSNLRHPRILFTLSENEIFSNNTFTSNKWYQLFKSFDTKKYNDNPIVVAELLTSMVLI